MSKEIKIAGSISFGGKRLNVYGDLDAPLFKAKDISHAIGYSSGNEWRMLEMCEEDEKLKLPLVVAGQRRSVNFVTENGLYNILAQSRMEIARSWRRVVHDELINMRKEKGRNITEQFEEWDHAMDNIYFDEETLEDLAIDDKILVKAYGQGLSIENHEDIAVMSIDPNLFEKLGITESIIIQIGGDLDILKGEFE